LITTEAYFTDRVDIKNVHERNNWGTKHLESMYTGKATLNGFYPYNDIVWESMGANFSAAVFASGRDHIKIMAYNLDDAPISGKIHFWNLAPGEYELVAGIDRNNDRQIDAVAARTKFTMGTHSGSCPVNLPVQSVQIFEILKLSGSQDKIRKAEADLAITASEITLQKNGTAYKISVPVHNIGLVEANNEQKIIARKTIGHLDAPLDLKPRIKIVEFVLESNKISSDHVVIHVNADKKIPEITHRNNKISIHINQN
jgi:hypothetical protein